MRGAIIAKENDYEKIYVEKIFDSIWRDGLNMNDNIIINNDLEESKKIAHTLIKEFIDE